VVPSPAPGDLAGTPVRTRPRGTVRAGRRSPAAPARPPSPGRGPVPPGAGQRRASAQAASSTRARVGSIPCRPRTQALRVVKPSARCTPGCHATTSRGAVRASRDCSRASARRRRASRPMASASWRSSRSSRGFGAGVPGPGPQEPRQRRWCLLDGMRSGATASPPSASASSDSSPGSRVGSAERTSAAISSVAFTTGAGDPSRARRRRAPLRFRSVRMPGRISRNRPEDQQARDLSDPTDTWRPRAMVPSPASSTARRRSQPSWEAGARAAGQPGAAAPDDGPRAPRSR
jgi:hypothetical protein